MIDNLIQRLQDAEEEDWELTRDIGLVIDGWSYLPDNHHIASRYKEMRWLKNNNGDIFADSSGSIQEPAYTSYIDAAIDLFEKLYPDHDWMIAKTGYKDGVYQNGLVGVYIQEPFQSHHNIEVFAATPALAICLACVVLYKKEHP